MSSENPRKAEPGLFKTLKADVREGGLKQSLKQDWRDLKQFYLDETHKKRLAKMGWLRRGMYLTVWLFKSMLLRLTPLRRVMIVLGFVFLFVAPSVTFEDNNIIYKNETGALGGALILIVLMLELKDKLLAQTELSAGRRVQFALMPEEHPQVPGWDVWLYNRPANEVGGDLLDFQKLNGGSYGIALGDVAGKGLPAALLMAKLQSTIRTLAPDYPDLARLGEKINCIFYRDGLRNRFASLIYLTVAENKGSVQYLNAGHMPPIIIRAGEIESHGKGEMAMGLTGDSTYQTHCLELNVDDWLLLYSDGLNEAQNAEGDFFGENRLQKRLAELVNGPAGRMGQELLATVIGFSGEAQLTDDLTLVILKRIA